MPYAVSTPVFEGPFDVLLHLITRQQVDLWEVSLSAIVDDYVAAMEGLVAGLDLDGATEFLLIAAVLLELKARRLLPGSDDTESEEELALWEQRDLLLARLLECKTFKDASAALVRMMDAAALSQPRTAGLDERYLGLAPDPLADVGPDQLRRAMESVLSPRPVARVDLDHVAPIGISVADATEELERRLPAMGQTTFAALCDPLGDRLAVIVCFLALLELCKQGLVDLDQAGCFATLHVRWLGEAA